MVLSAAYFLDLYRRAFFGPATSRPWRGPRSAARELVLILVFVALILGFGLFPAPSSTHRAVAAAWAANLARVGL